MEQKLNIDNWKWCEICETITYLYDCDCAGSLCNCGGCCDCDWQRNLAMEALKSGNHPTEESLKRIVIDNYKNYIISEKYNNTEDLMLHTLLKSEKPKLLILAEQELSNGKC